MRNNKITFEYWFRNFKPLLDEDLEAKLVDYKYASNFDSRQVWTLLDGGNNKSVIVAGIRSNALGYFVTSEMFKHSGEEIIVSC